MDFVHEGFEAELAGTTGAGHATALAAYQDWHRSVGPDPDEALPEIDLRRPWDYADRCWLWVGAVTDAARSYLAGEDVEPVELDGDLMLAQMIAAAARPL